MPYVEIRVVDANTGLAVQNAFVDLDGWTAVTDFDGTAVFNVPRGWYTLVVTHRDYTAHRQRISVLRDTRITVRLVPLVRILR